MKQYIDKSSVLAKIEKLQDSTMDEDGNFCTAEAQAEYDVLCVLEEYLDTLEVKEIGVDLVDPKEEPVIEDLEDAANDYAHDLLHDDVFETFKAGAKWCKKQAEIQIKAQSMALSHGCPKKEPTSEDLEEAAMQYAKSKHEDEVLQQIVSWDFKAGAKWQKEQMIDKGWEYINNQLNLPSDFEQHFRKAMEE